MKNLNRIMLIDDNKLDNFFHKRVITKYNESLEVIEMLSATDALDYLTTNTSDTRPDIIFLDINMPGMNGWEFLEEYKNLPEEMRVSMLVIMLTTSENPDERERAHKHKELVDFISKPLNNEMLGIIVTKFQEA